MVGRQNSNLVKWQVDKTARNQFFVIAEKNIE
jgi:hypothetical protein